jgi:predicted Rossmann fold flavoprotein
MKNYDVLILGAGASGLMCAGNLPKKMRVGVIDVNEKAAKKLKISGGGKCNITNADVALSNYDGGEILLQAVFKKFDKEKLLNFLDRNRVELELRKGRYYFCKNSSDDIIEILLRAAKNAELCLREKLLDVKKNGEFFEIVTDKSVRQAKNVVIATGGESFKNLGASDIGLKIAENFGIKVKKFTPALVGLTLQKEQFWMKELSGLSCFVEISLHNRVLREEMLFTHKGISGPAVLCASLYWKKGDISINFLPNDKIESVVKDGGKKQLSSAIPLPKRLVKALLKAVNVQDKECSKVNKDDMKKLLQLHHYTFAPAGNFGFSKAEVSRGGVMADELEAQSLESKRVKGLYFIGEVVDITGELGGYNFQWAFSSAYVCAETIK